MATTRPQINLDGTWQFHIEGETEARKIAVPLPWEAAFPHLRDKPTTATYSRTVRVPANWKSHIVRLHVGASDYYSEVSVNGYLVGVHEGGYLPFDFEVQEFLQAGAENVISVKVTDGAPARMVSGQGDLTPEKRALEAARPFPFTEIPHGKQSWYVTVGGIWQSVWLEKCDETFVDNVFVRPLLPKEAVSVRVRLFHPPLDPEGWKLRLTVTPPPGGSTTPPLDVLLDDNRKAFYDLVLPVPAPLLWDTDTPHLYGLTVEVVKDGKTRDEFQTCWGMRTIEARDGQILLNNHPVFIAGALDQDFYPGTIYTPPSTAFLRDQFVKAKQLGLNLLRCHIKTPDPRYLELCDELGLMVWYEIPNWAVLTKKSGKRGREHLEAMLERDYNHASLLILSVMNESWGIDLSEKWQREWLVEMFDYTKSLDPTRLVVDNSACEGNFHLKSDLDDYHVYFSVPDHADRWANWCADFAGRAAFPWSRYGDSLRTKKEPIVLSEFGNWGLPKLSLLRKGYGGSDPWWFATGAGAARPEGLEARYKQFNLHRIWGPIDKMSEASQEQEWLSLKWEIEAMRKHSSIYGYVITEFTDLHWEANGLLDMCRNPKVFHNRMASIQGQDALLPDHKKTAYWGGERFALPILLSHFSRRDLVGATVAWQIEGFPDLAGELPLPASPPIGASSVGEIAFRVPDVPRASDAVLRLRLLDAAGHEITANYERFTFFPASARHADVRTPIFVHDPLNCLPNAQAVLREAEIPVADRLEGGVVCIASVLDEKVLRFVQNGGTALLLALDRESIPRTTSGLASVSRDKNGWWGDWCSGLNFFRPDGAKTGGPWAGLPQVKQFDFTFRKIIPRRVLVGWDMEHDFDDVWAGLFLGWVRLPATLAGGFRYGNGKVLATTLDWFKNAKTDPVSVVMLASVLRFIASPRFAPRKTVEMTRLELSHTLIPTAENDGTTWRYTTTLPPDGWTQPGFDDSGWKTGKSGFGRGLSQVTTRAKWRDPDIYLRLTVTVPPEGISAAHLRYFHDDDLEVFVNGEPLFTRPGYTVDYEDITLSPDMTALFVPGKNTVAVHCLNHSGPQYVDIGITVEPNPSGGIAAPVAEASSSGAGGVMATGNVAASSQQMAQHEEKELETTQGKNTG